MYIFSFHKIFHLINFISFYSFFINICHVKTFTNVLHAKHMVHEPTFHRGIVIGVGWAVKKKVFYLYNYKFSDRVYTLHCPAGL